MKTRKVMSVMLTIIVLSGLLFIGSFAFGQICPSGMVSYWRADGDATDSYGDNDGALMNGATATATGQVGQAFSFDGGNDYVRIPNSNNLNFIEAVTAEAWVKPNGNPWRYQMLLEKGTWAGNAAWFFFIHRYEGYLHYNFGIGIPGGIEFKNCPMIGDLEDGVWSHIVGTYDRQNIKFYVNGVLNNQVAWTEPIRLNPYVLSIGVDGSRWHYKGDVDEVAIYNRALTADEIQQHYQNGLAGFGYCITPSEAIEHLTATIENMNLHQGIENSLTSKLENVIAKLEKGTVNAAINQLEAFINAVEAQRGNKLTEEQADELVDVANSIISMLLGAAKRVAHQNKTEIPETFNLFQNSPNPFNPLTTIQYNVPVGNTEYVRLNVYDLRGALVRILVDNVVVPGYHSIVWDGTDKTGKKVSSGIYIYQLKAGEFTKSNKMILMR